MIIAKQIPVDEQSGSYDSMIKCLDDFNLSIYGNKNARSFLNYKIEAILKFIRCDELRILNFNNRKHLINFIRSNFVYTNRFKQYTEEELNRAANILIDYYKAQKRTKFLELETLTKLANIAYGGNWIYMNINGFHKAEWNYIIYDRDQMHFDSKEAEEDFINIFTAYCYDLGSQWEVYTDEERLGYCYSPYDITSLDKLKHDILKRFEKENEKIKIIPFKEYIKTPVWGDAL